MLSCQIPASWTEHPFASLSPTSSFVRSVSTPVLIVAALRITAVHELKNLTLQLPPKWKSGLRLSMDLGLRIYLGERTWCRYGLGLADQDPYALEADERERVSAELGRQLACLSTSVA